MRRESPEQRTIIAAGERWGTKVVVAVRMPGEAIGRGMQMQQPLPEALPLGDAR